jgi:anti-sigma factor RsiW
MSCEQITTRSFVDYWCGDLEMAAAEELEEHLFACAQCADRSEKLAAIAALVRDATRVGDVPPVLLTRSALQRLQEDGVPLRHYTIHRGETVPCQATPTHFSVVHLRLDRPTAKTRIDVGIETSLGMSIAHEDVAVNHLDREVSLAWPGEMVRAQPTSILTITLTEVDGAQRRVLGEYKLSHTAD